MIKRRAVLAQPCIMLVTLIMHAARAAKPRLSKLRLLYLYLRVNLQWSILKEYWNLVLIRIIRRRHAHNL